jgi:hypothetical protein
MSWECARCIDKNVLYTNLGRYVLWWKPLTEEAQNDINNEAIRERATRCVCATSA